MEREKIRISDLSFDKLTLNIYICACKYKFIFLLCSKSSHPDKRFQQGGKAVSGSFDLVVPGGA